MSIPLSIVDVRHRHMNLFKELMSRDWWVVLALILRLCSVGFEDLVFLFHVGENGLRAGTLVINQDGYVRPQSTKLIDRLNSDMPVV